MVTLPAGWPAAAVAARLSALAQQSPATTALLRALPGGALIARNAELPRAGRLRLLAEGLAARHRLAPDGRRQILTFLVPGDLIGDPWSEARRTGPETGWPAAPPPLFDDEPLVALTPLRLIDGSALAGAIAESPRDHEGLVEAFRLDRRLQEHWLLGQLVRLGQGLAHERLGHLLLELRDRLAMAGLARADALPLTPTQSMLAEALGLSIVHVNRVVQILRREGLVEIKGGWALLPDPEGLARMARYRSPGFVEVAQQPADTAPKSR